MNSYWYVTGLKTRASAEAALEESFAMGDISPGENPRVESYQVLIKTGGGTATRWGIKLDH